VRRRSVRSVSLSHCFDLDRLSDELDRFGQSRGAENKGALHDAGLAADIVVNAVAPGPTETAMLDRLTGSLEKKAAFYASIPLKRGGTAQEVADAIQFVASTKAGFIIWRPFAGTAGGRSLPSLGSMSHPGFH
jgi:NAD(P)-dependent dehydrogenase (short-subunit alcohol dehydrogenase family)